jgi:V/A-type H+-transporting ATPase subunit F
MTVKIVGDIVTVRGFGFAGIEGVVVESAEEAKKIISNFLVQPDIGLVLVAQSIADKLGGEFDDYKLRKDFPLIMNIPDSTGAGMEAEDIQQLVQQALGLKV